MSVKPKYSLITDIEQQALEARRRNYTATQRGVIAWRILSSTNLSEHGITKIKLAESFDIAVSTLHATGKVLKLGTEEEVAMAESGMLSANIVAREILAGIPPEKRSKTGAGRHVPRHQGRLASVVYARIEEEKGKRVPVPSFRKRQVLDLPPKLKTVVPEVPEFTLQDAVDRLVKASNEISADEAALMLGAVTNSKQSQHVFSELVMWLIEVSDKLDILIDVKE